VLGEEDGEGEQGERVHSNGPNDVSSFGPYVFFFFSLFYSLTISFLSLACKLHAIPPSPPNDTHHHEPLLTRWWISLAPYETTPTPASSCLWGGSSVSPGAAAPWATSPPTTPPHVSRHLVQGHDDTAASNCLQCGPGWIPTPALTTAIRCRCCHQLLYSEPAIVGLLRCRSCW
jgi:hypothetical protein